jgi:hypothetical protein
MRSLILVLAVFAGVAHAGHRNIIVVTGQSNAKVHFANGIMSTIAVENPALFHRNHSGNWMVRWIDGEAGAYTLGPNFTSDLWNDQGDSELQQFIADIESNGDTWDIAGFFWFQGEGDSGSPYHRSVYAGRFQRMLRTIRVRYDLDHQIPFVVTAIDYNGDDEALFGVGGRTPGDIDAMRAIHFELGDALPSGATFDSRGWPRLDVWHIGSNTDPRHIYGPLIDFGAAQAPVLPEPRGLADLNGDGLRDLSDISLFVDSFVSNQPNADLALPLDVLDLADVEKFLSSFFD